MRLTPALDVLERAHGFVTGLMALTGAMAVVFLTAVTVVAVFWRYILNDPIFGIEDLSAMGLTVAVAGAIAYGATRGAHVSVNVLNYFAGRRATRFTDALVRLLGAGVIAFTSYALAIKGSCGFECGAFTANLFITHQPFYFLLSAAMAAYALLLFLQFVRGLLHFADAADPNEIRD